MGYCSDGMSFGWFLKNLMRLNLLGFCPNCHCEIFDDEDDPFALITAAWKRILERKVRMIF